MNDSKKKFTRVYLTTFYYLKKIRKYIKGNQKNQGDKKT